MLCCYMLSGWCSAACGRHISSVHTSGSWPLTCVFPSEIWTCRSSWSTLTLGLVATTSSLCPTTMVEWEEATVSITHFHTLSLFSASRQIEYISQTWGSGGYDCSIPGGLMWTSVVIYGVSFFFLQTHQTQLCLLNLTTDLTAGLLCIFRDTSVCFCFQALIWRLWIL